MECGQAAAGGTKSREGPPEPASPRRQCNAGEMSQTETKEEVRQLFCGQGLRETGLPTVWEADKSAKASRSRICTCVRNGFADKQRTVKQGPEGLRGASNG